MGLIGWFDLLRYSSTKWGDCALSLPLGSNLLCFVLGEPNLY